MTCHFIKYLYALSLLLLPFSALAEKYTDNLTKLATRYNDPTTHYLLGRKYYIGTEYPQDKKEAAKWFSRAADEGHVKAQYKLGKMYLYGDGIKKNIHLAHEFLIQAAKAKNIDAKFELANLYRKGQIKGKPNYHKAYIWYKSAAKEDHIGAIFYYGHLTYKGRGTKTDKTKGLKWINIAAEMGEPIAEKFIASLMKNDSQTKKIKSTKKNPIDHQSLKNLQQKPIDSTKVANNHKDDELKQASAGNVDAQYNMGMQLLNSENEKRSAISWLRRAAEQDHAGAQFQLGVMYRDGITVSKSDSEAIKWFRLASSWGVSSAQRELDRLLRKLIISSEDFISKNPALAKSDAQYTLGMMYTKGDGVQKDPYSGIQWLQKAALQNHVEAQYKLGQIYKEGTGVESNFHKAKLWLAKAAEPGLGKASQALQQILSSEEQKLTDEHISALRNSSLNSLLAKAKNGDPEAQYEIGVMYINGSTNIKKDIDKGLTWLEHAAEDHYVLAQISLAEFYTQGVYVDKDYLQATRWYKMAADSGSPEAQYNLGNIYRRGMGVTRSHIIANKWFHLAAQQGHIQARKSLESCKLC